MRNAAGIIIAYAGEYVLAGVDDASSDIGSDDLEDESSGVGNKRSRRKSEHRYRAFNDAEWKSILPWLLLVSTLTGEQICPHRGKDCLGCAACAAMFCSVCMERNTRPAQ